MPAAAHDLPRHFPVFPLRGSVLLPYGRLPLHVFEPRYRALVRDVLAGEGMFGMIQPRPGHEGDPRPPLYVTGCLGRVAAHRPLPDGRFLVVLAGICRFDLVEELEVETPYRQVEAAFDRWLADLAPVEDAPHLAGRLLPLVDRYLDLLGAEVDRTALRRMPFPVLVAMLTTVLPLDPEEKQAVLEARDLAAQAAVLEGLLEIGLAGDTSRERPH